MTGIEDALFHKIQGAVLVVNRAEGDLVEASKSLGLLLLEAKNKHPAVKDFEAYLRRVDGLHLSRAYDYMRIAGGRTTDEQLRKDARERQKKSRKKKQPKKQPETTIFRDVTESRETPECAHSSPAASSSRALAEFSYAARQWIPRMFPADKARALDLVQILIQNREAA